MYCITVCLINTVYQFCELAYYNPAVTLIFTRPCNCFLIARLVKIKLQAHYQAPVHKSLAPRLHKQLCLMKSRKCCVGNWRVANGDRPTRPSNIKRSVAEWGWRSRHIQRRCSWRMTILCRRQITWWQSPANNRVPTVVHERCQLECDTVANWQPMKRLQDRCDGPANNSALRSAQMQSM